MKIVVNGKQQEVPQETNVLQLLAHLNISPERIALEIDLTVIDSEVYHATQLREGARIEIISFIGGGVYAE